MTIYPMGGERIDRTALFIANHLRVKAGCAPVESLEEVDNAHDMRMLTRDILTIYRDGTIELEAAQW